MTNKKILIVGGGAIGGMTAAHMIKAGYNVTLYDTDKVHVDTINSNGLLIETRHEKNTIIIPSTTSLTDTFDIVFLSVKSLHTKKALESIKAHIKNDSLVVSLQNGINEELIAEMIGSHRTIGAVVGWGCTNVGPGHIKQTSEGTFTIGQLDGMITPELKEIKTMLESFTVTTITTNIMGHLWIKLLINCAIAPVGASFGAEVNDLVKDKRLVPIMIGLTNELVSVALEEDVKIEKFQDMLDINLLKVNNFTDYKRAVAIMRIAGEQHKSIKSTIWQDLEKGRKTEIDYLNGFIEKKAEEFGIPTPINKAIITLLKKVENGEKTPSIENVNEFYEHVRIPREWRDYDFDEDPFHSLNLFSLPDDQKHMQASNLTAAHLLGLTIAFSKAFDKITKSLIGKIFIRKTSWEIINLVLSSFFEEMGKTFAKRVCSAYNIQKKDVSTVTKIIIFYLNNLNFSYSIQKMNATESIITIRKKDDIFYQTIKQFSIEKKLSLPLLKPFIKGITQQINEQIHSDCKKTSLNEEEIYEINVDLK